MKTLFYCLRAFIALLLVAGATSCSVSLFPKKETGQAPTEQTPSPREARRVFDFLAKYPEFINQHPEFFPRDTVRIQIPFTLPPVVIHKTVTVHDTLFVAADNHYLDTLLLELHRSVNEAQRQATEAKLHELLANRPVLRDTLRADTLGVHLKVWLSGRYSYGISIRRDAIQGKAAGQVVRGGLAPCPALPAPVHYPFYHPGGWPWYVLLLLGCALGAGATVGLARLLARVLPSKYA
jgi:hypothetical protein